MPNFAALLALVRPARLRNIPGLRPGLWLYLLPRLVLHGLIVWLVCIPELWPGATTFVFVMLALAVAVRSLSTLPVPVKVTAAGLHLCGRQRERLIGVTDILLLEVVPPGAMAWHILWPATPWRLLSVPDSLENWWRIDTRDGSHFFRSEQVAALNALNAASASFRRDKHLGTMQNDKPLKPMHANSSTPANLRPYRIASFWSPELAVSLLLLILSQVFWVPILFYIVARSWKAIWQRHKLKRWQRISARLAAPLPTTMIAKATEGISPTSKSNASMPGSPTKNRLLRSAKSFLLGLMGWIFMPLIWAGWQFGALVLLLLRVPSLLLRVLSAIASLGRTVALTLLGWVIAVFLSWPFVLFFPAPTTTTWPQEWLVRSLMWRFSGLAAERPLTAMLEQAQATGDTQAGRLILQGGAVNGVFRLAGWQAVRKQSGTCRDAVPQIDNLRLILDEKLSSADLLRELACATRPKPQPERMPGNSPTHLQVNLLVDAFQRSGQGLDIFSAVASGEPSLLPLVLDKQAMPQARDWQGRTPLMLALDLAALGGERRTNRLEIACLLRQRGADMAALDSAGRSTTYLAVQAGLEGAALEPYLHASVAQPALQRSAPGATLVHAAATSGAVKTLESVLAAGADPASLTTDGRSALHFARGAAMVQALFQHGLNPEAQDIRGRLPLHAAIIAGDIDAARALADITRSPQQRDAFGRKPLDYVPAQQPQHRPPKISATTHKMAATGNSPIDDDGPWHLLVQEITERASK